MLLTRDRRGFFHVYIPGKRLEILTWTKLFKNLKSNSALSNEPKHVCIEACADVWVMRHGAKE